MSDDSNAAVGRALIEQAVLHLNDESMPRILKCLDKLNEEEIWFRPNEETTSIGNLVLHLCGNVRQWIISGLGGAADHRERAKEFEDSRDMNAEQLVARLEATMSEAREVLNRLDPESLLAPKCVQGYDTTGLGILVHVVEHFSYHTGEITYAVKSRKAIDMGYYEGEDLGVTN